jgi:hypothetical protein
MRLGVAVAIAIVVAGPATAQDQGPSTREEVTKDLQSYIASPGEIEEPFFEVSFAVVATVARYPEALRIAKEASRKLKIPLGLRGLRFDKELGLTHSRASCMANDDTYPCYRPRGRWDDGEYVSVEIGFDRAYDVVVASGREGTDRGFKPDILDRARRFFPAAQIKKSKVWFGCIH